jgi:hypothetical protein
MLMFLGGIGAALILALLAVLYLTGHGPLDPGRHVKHAILFAAVAIGALVVANFNRPGVPVR